MIKQPEECSAFLAEGHAFVRDAAKLNEDCTGGAGESVTMDANAGSMKQ